MGAFKKTPTHYYASGKRVPLTVDDNLIAVDSRRFSQLKASPQLLSIVQSKGTEIGHDLILLARDRMDSDAAKKLVDTGVTQPVYHSSGATIVALPEIRIEESSSKKLEQVIQFVTGFAFDVEGEPDSGRLSLRPRSQDARDSMELANKIAMNFKPISVSPRFVRITPGPVLRK